MPSFPVIRFLGRCVESGGGRGERGRERKEGRKGGRERGRGRRGKGEGEEGKRGEGKRRGGERNCWGIGKAYGL